MNANTTTFGREVEKRVKKEGFDPVIVDGEKRAKCLCGQLIAIHDQTIVEHVTGTLRQHKNSCGAHHAHRTTQNRAGQIMDELDNLGEYSADMDAQLARKIRRRAQELVQAADHLAEEMETKAAEEGEQINCVPCQDERVIPTTGGEKVCPHCGGE